MASVFIKRGRYWARLKGDKQPGKWSNAPMQTADRDEAVKRAKLAQQTIDKRNRTRTAGADTLREFVRSWLTKRQEADHDWKKDRGKLRKHILPALGDVALADITTAMVADLVHDLRFKKKKANRTTRNIYSVLAAVLRDAAMAGKIATSPCILTEVQLGAIVDKDPEWRDGAVFTRDEASQMLGDPRIPLDRRMVYAFGLLAGLRPGEAAALRWRHLDTTATPLPRLTVALSYSTSRSQTKRTKTESVRHVPVHPTLAAMLAEWRGACWGAGADDLIVPLPPDVKRTRRKGERFRGTDYTGKRWREVDLPALGWRARSVYDTKSTFITLAIEDGADPTILEERVTHTRNKRSAFKGYDRGPHWVATCREVAKLKLAPTVHPLSKSSSGKRRSGGGYRMPKPAISGEVQLRIVDGGKHDVCSQCGQSIAGVGASLHPLAIEEKSCG